MLRGAMLRGAYSFVACLSHLTIIMIDHASLSRRGAQWRGQYYWDAVFSQRLGVYSREWAPLSLCGLSPS